MTLHEGEKFRCGDCNAQVAVIRSSDTRSLDYEAPRVSIAGTAGYTENGANPEPRLYCCGKAMVRYCIKVA
jgi:hypothetical protein